ncbi:signal peptidase II [[Mycoplasma] testudinis]|uniref:signal peptidase II n=1 Tax=[Mycoplasma] testudinis TaxID=33924 RepID=UPI000695E960|nr:signal peptidase II [[Mycoplasma] testudinis]
MADTKRSFISNILFKTKDVFLKHNTKKTVLVKVLTFALIFTVVMLIVFLLRNRFAPFVTEALVLNPNLGVHVENSGFINIFLIFNTGIGFGNLAEQTGAVYFLQTLIMMIIIIWLLFVDTPDYIVFLSLIVSGSFANIMDRASSLNTFGIANAVLDYFQFWFGGAIFNFADSCIVVGFIDIVITYVVRLIIQTRNDAKDRKQEQDKAQREKQNQTTANSTIEKAPKIDHDVFA